MSTRIIAGQCRGTILQTPRGMATRPTLGRVRESLFMILMPWLPNAHVLDGFAGSGALGLEALSRGAESAVFLENAKPALDALKANIEKLRLGDQASTVSRDALAVLAQPQPPQGKPFDLILLDPPYGKDLCGQALALIAANRQRWLADDGLVAAQVGRNDPLEDAYGDLVCFRTVPYSQTRVAFYRMNQ